MSSDEVRWSFLRFTKHPNLGANWRSYLNPIVSPKLMTERGTKRGIIKRVSLRPMSFAPTNGEVVCDAKRTSLWEKKNNHTW